MNRDIRTNEPAFPVAFVQGNDPHGADVECGTRGMDLRTYFAGQALAGLCADSEFLLSTVPADIKAKLSLPEIIATTALAIADALLTDLAKEKTT